LISGSSKTFGLVCVPGQRLSDFLLRNKASIGENG